MSVTTTPYPAEFKFKSLINFVIKADQCQKNPPIANDQLGLLATSINGRVLERNTTVNCKTILTANEADCQQPPHPTKSKWNNSR